MTAEELLEIWSCGCKENDDCDGCFFTEICPYNMPRNPIKTLTTEAIESFIERAEKRFGKTGDHFRDATKMSTENTEDPVNHPPHYETGKFECFDVMREVYGDDAVRDFCLLNAFKYLYRCERKGKKAEDVKKAVWYLTRWLNLNNQE